MTRRMAADQEFGSDSFLDIIANIVGILIILIVVAGVKVARQPPDTEDRNIDATVTAENDSTQTRLATVAETPELQSIPASEAVDPEPIIVQNDVAQDARQWELQIEQLQQQIDTLRLTIDHDAKQVARTEADLGKARKRLAQSVQQRTVMTERNNEVADETELVNGHLSVLSKKLVAASTLTEQVNAQLAVSTRQQKDLLDRLKEIGYETRKLNDVLRETDREESNGPRIQHRLSPVGKTVEDDEIHIRVSHGRVAWLPLEPLLERLKAQVSARRGTVMRFNRYEGLVGPIGGFRMNYLVERTSLPPLQALQYGQNAYRVSVSRWTIVPSEDFTSESIPEALRLGSRLRQILESAAPDTTVTIWIYEDDFQYFPPLREFAHRLNLRVAARPLPVGTPISGSPGGSRSTSQ